MKGMWRGLYIMILVYLNLIGYVFIANAQQQDKIYPNTVTTSGTISKGMYFKLGDYKYIYFDLKEHPDKTFAIEDESIAVKNGLVVKASSSTNDSTGLYSTVNCKDWKVKLSAKKIEGNKYLVTSINILQRSKKGE